MRNPRIRENGQTFSGQVNILRTTEPEIVTWIPEDDAEKYANFEQLYADQNHHEYTAPAGKVYDKVVVNVGHDIVPKKRITENGRYSASSEGHEAYKKVIVDVPYTDGISQRIEANGTYYPPEGALFDELIVDVTEPLPPNPHPETVGHKTVTQNGIYNAADDGLEGYDEVTVEVASRDYKMQFETLQGGTDRCEASCVYDNHIHTFYGTIHTIMSIAGEMQTYTLPLSASGMSAITVRDKIHLIGGDTYGGTMMHKISADGGLTWTDAPAAPPSNCIYPNLVTDGLDIFMIGASSDTHAGDSVTTTLQIYISDIGLWGTGGAFPVPFYSGDEAIFYHDAFHIWKNGTHHIFYPRTFSWDVGNLVPEFFSQAAVSSNYYNLCILDDTIFLINASVYTTDIPVASYKEENVIGAGTYRMETWLPVSKNEWGRDRGQKAYKNDKIYSVKNQIVL